MAERMTGTAQLLFRRDDDGATAIEYGLIMALIGVVIITALTTLGHRIAGQPVPVDVPRTALPSASPHPEQVLEFFIAGGMLLAGVAVLWGMFRLGMRMVRVARFWMARRALAKTCLDTLPEGVYRLGEPGEMAKAWRRGTGAEPMSESIIASWKTRPLVIDPNHAMTRRLVLDVEVSEVAGRKRAVVHAARTVTGAASMRLREYRRVCAG